MTRAILSLVALLSLVGCQKPLPLVRPEVPSLTVRLDIPAPETSAGGLVVADLNQDERPDFLVSVPGHLAVYDNSGSEIWIERADIVGCGEPLDDRMEPLVDLGRDERMDVID